MNSSYIRFSQILLILQIAAAGVFAGRAWQHLFWDVPIRTLLWDEGWMRPIVEQLFNTNWEDYITNADIDEHIETTSQVFGYFYLCCALIAVFARKLPPAFWNFLLIGGGGLIFLALLYCKERFFSVGQFFEYSLQFMAPYFLYRILKNNDLSDKLMGLMRLSIALTFTCHGLYAINYYPRPGHFVEMTMNILPIGEGSAHQLLWWAGILDFLVSAIILFLPSRWIKPALIYAIIWGFGTSIARVWAHFYYEAIGDSLHQWLYEAIYRVPHFLIPLVVFMYYSGKFTKVMDREAV